MRKNLGARPILYPMPVMIIGTYDENGVANAMTAAWGGISEMKEISICVDDGHKTARNAVESGAFTVSIADVENLVATDFVGIVSGNNDVNKLQRCGWTIEKSELVNAPIFAELPLILECKLISFTEETCRMVGEILNVSVDERILDDNGRVSLEKFHPITYDPMNHTYVTLGEVVGKAYTDGLKLK